MFATKQIIASVLFAIAMTSVTAVPSQHMSGAVVERDVAVEGYHLATEHVNFKQAVKRQDGGDAFSGASGPADGGDAATNQRNGLLNLNAANFGKNGGRAGTSTTGDATGGNGGSVVDNANPAPAPMPPVEHHNPAPPAEHNPAPPMEHNPAPPMENPNPGPAPGPVVIVEEECVGSADGGDAFTGASGSAEGGDATTSQSGLINADLLNFGGNGGRGGRSASGNANGGAGGSRICQRSVAV